MIVNDEEEVVNALHKLKHGKSNDTDGVSAEHFIYCKKYLVRPLCCLFTSLLVHGYMPENMMKSIIVPIVKNKTRSITNSSSYRPIALSTIMSKLFEFVLYAKLEPYLNICDNQFGYQTGYGTELCVFTLMETIRYYQKAGSHVFVCYLDASAAFDRLCHTILFRKLIDNNNNNEFIYTR
jgi:hypothetical protein